MTPISPNGSMPKLCQLAVVLGAVGIAAGVVGQIADNSIHGNNPLLLAGSILLGAGLISSAIVSRP